MELSEYIDLLERNNEQLRETCQRALAYLERGRKTAPVEAVNWVIADLRTTLDGTVIEVPENDSRWTIGNQQHEDNTLYYRQVGEGIKRFER